MQSDKPLCIRIPRELWLFLKTKAAYENTSMSKIIEKSINRMKLHSEKKELTEDDINI
jgi:hypothetical protein